MKLLIKLLKILLLTLLLSFLLFLLFYLSGIRIFPVTFAALVSQAPLELQNEVLERVIPLCLETMIESIPISVNTIIESIKFVTIHDSLVNISTRNWQDINFKILETINSKKEDFCVRMRPSIKRIILGILDKCHIFSNQFISPEIKKLIEIEIKDGVSNLFTFLAEDLCNTLFENVEIYLGKPLSSHFLNHEAFYFPNNNNMSDNTFVRSVIWNEFEKDNRDYEITVRSALTRKMYNKLNIWNSI